jgi:hypothetical protein
MRYWDAYLQHRHDGKPGTDTGHRDRCGTRGVYADDKLQVQITTVIRYLPTACVMEARPGPWHRAAQEEDTTQHKETACHALHHATSCLKIRHSILTQTLARSILC